MPAKFSTKKRDAERAERIASQQRRKEEQRRAARANNEKLQALVEPTIIMLIRNNWTVRTVEPGQVWEVKPPGAASMIVRGWESLQRKALGMR